MQISALHSEGSGILDVSGDIDLAHSPELRKVLLDEIEEKHNPKVLLNLWLANGYAGSILSVIAPRRSDASHFGAHLVAVKRNGPCSRFSR